VGRILLSAAFLISGAGSLASPRETVQYIASAGLPVPELGVAIQVLVEVGGGLALIVGYRARFVAAALAAFCIATALAFHLQWADENQRWNLLKNLAMAGGLMQIVAFGAGRISLDARARLGLRSGARTAVAPDCTDAVRREGH
jgi:putative oxidoreductase